MTKNEAIKILGLNNDFTETELKRAYWKLAQKYHPDYHMENATNEEEANEKMKKINEARELLKSQIWQSETARLKQELFIKMDSFWQRTTVGDVTLIMGIKAEAAHIKNTLEAYPITEALIESKYELFLRNVKKIYKSYQTNFFKQNFIYEEDVKEELNYQSNVEEFYKQLLRIKDKYSRKNLFEKRVESEIEKYHLYATYNQRIEKLIQIAVHNAELKAKNNQYKDIETIILEMQQEIEEIFALVAEINTIINNFEQALETIEDESLKKELLRIKEQFANGDALIDIKRKLTELELKIKEYHEEQKRLDEIKKNDTVIRELYNQLRESFNNALKKYKSNGNDS